MSYIPVWLPNVTLKNDYLALALQYKDKRQWASGESIWLAEGRDARGYKCGVFLSNHGLTETIELHVTDFTGHGCSTPIFYLSYKDGWKVVDNIEYKFDIWVRRAAKYIQNVEQYLPEVSVEVS